MSKNKLTRKQLILVFIPFWSTVGYVMYLSFKKRYYTKECMISILKASAATFVAGAALILIGLYSYFPIICSAITGITMNLVFFKSYNRMNSNR